MPHFKSLFPSKYLNANDIIEPYDVTISKIEIENVGTQDQKEEKLVAYFDEPGRKPIVLNMTRAEAVAEIAQNPDYTFWVGVRVRVTKGSTRFAGKKTACIDLNPPVGTEKLKKNKSPRNAKPAPAAVPAPDDTEEIPF